MTLPFEPVSDGVRIAVRLSPKASRAGVAGLSIDAEGRAYVKMRVTAPARDGKANTALLKLLAKEWGLARGSLRIGSGKHDRRKTVHLAGDPPFLMEKLRCWVEDMNHE